MLTTIVGPSELIVTLDGVNVKFCEGSPNSLACKVISMTLSDIALTVSENSRVSRPSLTSILNAVNRG